ncbi:uncharacterized protein cubi_00865 [Cryptosporidium ubiquitum]|uniref:Uncharacterized protein n=1 Tax=Cryptosporidium ubiquitum TaxID=857276 RepID=A0A1J4MJ58_9CRYT|nr:uncharacterized protein cubi_00865 [Cryptosporidium ubiquitum]OII72893.1 hypothetical protein cubi_00865 [Cryptosporidium ubiquitum]
MNGSKNRPSFLVKILLFFLTFEYLFFCSEAYGSELSQSLTGITGYDGSIQSINDLEEKTSNPELKDDSIIFGQDASLSPDSKTLGELSEIKTKPLDDSLNLLPDSSGVERSISKSSLSPRKPQLSPTIEQSPSKKSRSRSKENFSSFKESSKSLSKSKTQERTKSLPKKATPKDNKYHSPTSLFSESSPSEKSRSRSPSRSKSSSGYGKRSISSPKILISKTEKSSSKSKKRSEQSPISEYASLKEQEASSSPIMENMIPLTAPDMSPSPKSSYNPPTPSETSTSILEASSSPSSLLDGSLSQEISVSSPESTSPLSEELSVKDNSMSVSQMPSRKSSGVSESSSPRPYTPVDEGTEFSTLLDGSLSSNEPVDTSQLPLDVASESNIGSNYMTLLSSLYGTQALSGVPLNFSEELFRVEILVSEAFYNTELSISNADITLFTKRVILESSSIDKNTSFGAKMDPNSFEKIPSFSKVTFNFLECVYQLDNILFHTRSFIKPVSMSHILKGCDNIRSSLNIQKSIMENNKIFSKALQYLILRIYNISNDEIISIVNQRSSIPTILDQNAFKSLQNSLIEDFTSNSGSLPLPFEFWRTIFVQQLHAFEFYSRDLINTFLADNFGLMDILLDAMYSDPIKMCPYITAVLFFKVNPFKIEDARINSAKIQTFCLIYLKNIGLNESVTLKKLNMPTINRNSRLDQVAKQLAPGFEILPYFHPDFPKNGKDLTWETCYSIYSSVSMMLNSLKVDLVFPQISPLCTKITKESYSPEFILGMFSRILDIPSTIQNDLLEIQDVNQIISSLSLKLKIPETYLREFYTDYIQGNPIKYLNTIYTIFTNSIKFYSGIDSNQESKGKPKTNQNFDQLYLTRNVSDNTQMFQRLNYWSTIHLYFLSFTMRIPNSSEILSGIYSFTPSNCESLLFSFFRRVSYSTRSSIVDSLTLCITMYSVLYKNHISPVLVKNFSMKDLRDALNYKIGTWAPTQNDWMRSIYMVFENKLEIIPNISNIQTLSFTVNEDFFNCFYSVNKYLHGMIVVTRHKDSITSRIKNRVLNERTLGFSLCSSMSIGAHSTKEEAIELRIISTVIESIRQFGFKINVESIKEFISYHKQTNRSAFPSGNTILEHSISKFPKNLGTVIKKAFQSNLYSSNSLPYFIQAEELILRSLQSRGCSIQNDEVSYNEQSFELSRDTSVSIGKKNVSYYNIINSCLSWKTFGYFNLISCYSALVNAGTCETKDTTLEVLVEIAEKLEWPKELILLTLSQDFSFSEFQIFQKIKQSVNPEEFEKYTEITKDLITYVEERINDFSWSEKSLSNPESMSPMLGESSLEASRSQVQEINYSFAFGLNKDSIGDYLSLWKYRKEAVLKQIQSFPVNPSLILDQDEISSILVDPSSQSIKKFINLKLTPFVTQLKEFCYKEPHGAFLCEINPQLGLPPLKVAGNGSNTVSISISVTNPPKELEQDHIVEIMVATPLNSSTNWQVLKPQSLLFLSVLMGPKWNKELKTYTRLSTKYFPYSGKYIRLTPPVFKIKISRTEPYETSELLDSSISPSTSRSITKSSKTLVLPGVWHENLGNISIQKLLEFSKFVPNNSNLLINIVWTLASALNSLWIGGVELCYIDLRSIYVYTGSQSQQNLNIGRILDEFLEFGPDEENVHSLTNFVLKTLSPPLIRFGELGRSKYNLEVDSNESSHSTKSECNDKKETVKIFEEILSSTELSGKTKGQSLETICQEISKIDPTKLDCSSLAWVDEQNSRIPNDLEKWPITDVIMVSPALKEEEVKIPETVVPDAVFLDGSKYPEKSKSPTDLSPYSIPASIPVSISNSEPSLKEKYSPKEPEKDVSPKESQKKELSPKESQKKEVSPESPLSEESEFEKTSSSEIFDQRSVSQGESSVLPVNPTLVAPFPIEKPYRPEDLNEFTLVKVPKGKLMDLPIFPKIPGVLSEQKKFEIKELLTALKGVTEKLVSKFTSWSASILGKHSSTVPDLNFKPSFIFIPPTPNNRADSPKILEKNFYIYESVFLFAREELQRMELPIQQMREEDLVEVFISRAGLSYINNNKVPPSVVKSQTSSFPEIKPTITPVSQVPSSIVMNNGQEISRLISGIEKSKGYNGSTGVQKSSELSNSLENRSDLSLESGLSSEENLSSQREKSLSSETRSNVKRRKKMSKKLNSDSQGLTETKSKEESEKGEEKTSSKPEYGYGVDSSIIGGVEKTSSFIGQGYGSELSDTGEKFSSKSESALESEETTESSNSISRSETET